MEMEMPTFTLFVCMMGFQKLRWKKQIILKRKDSEHTCQTCTGDVRNDERKGKRRTDGASLTWFCVPAR